MDRRWLPPALLATFFLVVVIIVASGGGDDSSSGGSRSSSTFDIQATPFEDVPVGAPMVMRIQTGTDAAGVGAAAALTGDLPSGTLAVDALITSATKRFGLDGAPASSVFGGPVVLWSEKAKRMVKDLHAEWVAADPDALDQALQQQVSGGQLSQAGERDNSRLYTARNGAVLAVDGARVLAVPSRNALDRVLDRRENEAAHYTRADFDARQKAVPGAGSALAVISLSPTGLGIDDELSSAVTWLSALSYVTFAVVPTDDAITVPFAAVTDEFTVDPTDLPITPGKRAPVVHAPDDAQVTVSVRDASNALAFLQSYASVKAQKRVDAIQSAFNVINRSARIDVLSMLTNALSTDVTVSLPSHGKPLTLWARLGKAEELRGAMQDLQYQGTLSDVYDDDTGEVTDAGFTITRLGDSAFSLVRDDRAFASVAIIDDAFVLTTDPDATFESLDELALSGAPAAADAAETSSVRGTLIATINARVVRELITRFLAPPKGARNALEALNDATLTAQATPQKVVGALRIPVG